VTTVERNGNGIITKFEQRDRKKKTIAYLGAWYYYIAKNEGIAWS